MPVDYSKWDAIELSDDSDIEVHPNVDKKSFIRAKQAQIHRDRAERKHRITTLNFERTVNDGLIARIDLLLAALSQHKSEPSAHPDSVNELVLMSLVESGMGQDDEPPAPPPGMYKNTADRPTYSKMLVAVVDIVKKRVDEQKAENRLEAFVKGIKEEKMTIQDMQKKLMTELATLETEEKKHITSDDLHLGFDSSSINKTPSDPAPAKTTSVEQINPTFSGTEAMTPSSGEEADAEDGEDQKIQATPAAMKFAEIAVGDYKTSLQFVMGNRSILTQKDSDALLVEAYRNEMADKFALAKRCVHQSLLLQYCRQLGQDGVGIFFNRMMTKDHKAYKLFMDDVGTTYQKIKQSAARDRKEREEHANSEGVEQIQLYAVDPGTKLTITVPPPIPTEGSSEPADEGAVAARKVFESLPAEFQKALETGELDEVNKALGKMEVGEAEAVVEKLGEGGILNVEEGVIDATTEEGQRMVEEMGRAGGKAVEDPPLD
jgi:cell division cycle protein 37